MELARTPLFDEHVQLQAKLADFGGWEMPIEYSGTVNEHTAVRTAVGMFDVSHMGKLRLNGSGALEWLATQLASHISQLSPGQAQYSLLLNEQAGVIDDLIVYVLAADEVWIVPNASNADNVFAVLSENVPASLELTNLHLDYGIIAVQGPDTGRALDAIGIATDLDYMQARHLIEVDAAAVLCRTGYTGEYGFELIVPNKYLVQLWKKLLAAGVVPAGLGARDTLRLEMGYPLHGHELSTEITPVMAGLSWAIAWEADFRGKPALDESRANPQRFRVALELIDRGIPRADMSIYRGTEFLGTTTSGTFSPSKKVGIGLGLVSEKLQIDDLVEVDVRGKRLSAKVVRLPFWPSRVR